ncbi:hypothetical protein RRF57_005878 [Xylaria bambusicola]|uniref:Uncharacterized protein n=1 Tax=Xylaria bambusicola TaxID=326684 RepID=A0AAN7UIJ4_9PEZI
MERRLTQHGDSLPHVANATRQASTNARDSDHYIPAREVYLRKNEMDPRKKRPPKTDREMSKYEDYLRNKWGCNDAIPDSFDPDKLDAVLRSRFPAKSTQQSPLESREKVQAPSAQPVKDAPATKEKESHEMPLKDISTSSSKIVNSSGSPAAVDADEQDINYNNETSMTENSTPEKNTLPRERSNSTTTTHRGRTNPVSEATDRPRTPRIRAGSKPPLSRSAFVAGGVPCEQELCEGQCKRDAGRRAKAPEYFPFKSSRARSRSRSRGRQSQST